MDPSNLSPDRALIRGSIEDFLNATEGDIQISGLASFEPESNFDKDPELSTARADTLELLIRRMLTGPARTINRIGYSHDADADDSELDSDARFRVAIATAAVKGPPKTRAATAELIEKPPVPVPDPPADHPPEAAEPERPPIFRRIGFRVRFERDQLVLGEVSGQLDFRTQAEEAAGFIKSGDTRKTARLGSRPR